MVDFCKVTTRMYVDDGILVVGTPPSGNTAHILEG